MLRMRILVIFFLVIWIGPIVIRVAQFYNFYSNWTTFWGGLSSSIYGFVNSLYWLTHRQVIEHLQALIKGDDRYTRRDIFSQDEDHQRWSGSSENDPLLRTSMAVIEPSEEDPIILALDDLFNQVDVQNIQVMFRINVITCILTGIKKSIHSLPSTSSGIFNSGGLLFIQEADE
jgi:hypothetical protein